MKLGTVLLSVLISVALAGCGSKKPSEQQVGEHNGEKPQYKAAPDFTLELVSGGTGSLSDYRGKVVVLNFWATWCPPCREEIPGFIALQNELADRGLQFIGVALEEPAPVKSYVKENGINYPVFIGNDEVEKKYGGINAIPTTFFLDRQGNIRKKIIGSRDKSFFEGEIKKLLQDKPGA